MTSLFRQTHTLHDNFHSILFCSLPLLDNTTVLYYIGPPSKKTTCTVYQQEPSGDGASQWNSVTSWRARRASLDLQQHEAAVHESKSGVLPRRALVRATQRRQQP